MSEDKYGAVSNRLEVDWYPYHQNEWFSHEDICRYFQWFEQETRKMVSRKLYHDSVELGEPRLEKQGKSFRIIDREEDELDWLNADPDNVTKIHFPYGVEDNTYFGFEDYVLIPPKSVIIVAGLSNEGKTTYCLNLMVLNMDTWKTIYFTNEMSAVGFKRRMRYFADWCELTNGTGKPKFKVITRYSNYQDVLDPDGLNIIDYLDANEQGEYYKIAPYIKGIHKKLRNGVAVIALQKPPGRSDAFGGANIRGVASLYVAIDKGKLEVVKAKDWTKDNPNGKKYSFEITHGGSMFANIKGIYEG